MNRVVRTALLSLPFFSLDALASSQEISVSPNPARPGEEIVLEISGVGSCPFVSSPLFADDAILVSYSGGGCLSPPRPFLFEVPLHPLDPASYRIFVAEFGPQGSLAVLDLEVLDDGASGDELALSTSPNPAFSDEEITLRISGVASCPGASAPVFAGKVLVVPFTPGLCAAPPHPFSLKVALGRQTPGDYTLHIVDMYQGDVLATHGFEVAPAPDGAQPACVSSPERLCLGENRRFAVEVDWRDFSDRSGRGVAVPFQSADAGLFWFFGAENWELAVKVLDGCSINDRHWVLASAATNVGFTLRVTDLETGDVREYTHPLGLEASAVIDTTAFASCSAP